MLYIYPDYYKQFKCIADRCEDTCCAGWQIVIDDETLENYEKVDKANPFRERLKKSVDWQESVFRQDGCGRCAFLNDKNLCDLYTALGEASLCHTCASYPRHTEEFENIREVTLSLSCPEVSRMLLSKVEPVTFYEEETNEEDDFEDFDILMLSILQDVRSNMFEIMQDRSIDISLRTAIIWKMAKNMQEKIDEGDAFACENIPDKYHNEVMIKRIKDRVNEILTVPLKRYKFALNMFKELYRLEILMEDWADRLDEASLLLYGKDEKEYFLLSKEFDDWVLENMPDWQIQCEQIVVYFLSTYMCGAVYDGWLEPKVKMSVAAIFYIHELLMAEWLKNGKVILFEDIVNVTYKFSRELEHSDINLDEMEQCMSEDF